MAHACRMNKTSEHPAAASAELYVNQLVSSSLDWQDVGLRIKQTASFAGPKNTAVTKLEFESDSGNGSPQVVIKLRIPSWVAEGAAEVNPPKQISPLFLTLHVRMGIPISINFYVTEHQQLTLMICSREQAVLQATVLINLACVTYDPLQCGACVASPVQDLSVQGWSRGS